MPPGPICKYCTELVNIKQSSLFGKVAYLPIPYVNKDMTTAISSEAKIIM